MIVRRLLVAALAVAALAACDPNTPAKPNNLVGVAPSAEASPSESPSPSPSPSPSMTPSAEIPAATTAVPTTQPPAPAATTKKPAPAKTTTKPPAPRTTPPAAVYYKNCADVRAHGAAPLYRGQPGYRSGLDRDNDGVACE
ncbi:excalibur calcium-binding domain-containing protein [Dactylosporangium sp. CA-139114]|uniref:excalibur calcium-binding domain-containing protein n=1 Tax=Dactylosporangium sp. CA-139114 TaxID=3239931 RepID=UPI003D97A75D